jgi:hypothetical protein
MTVIDECGSQGIHVDGQRGAPTQQKPRERILARLGLPIWYLTQMRSAINVGACEEIGLKVFW